MIDSGNRTEAGKLAGYAMRSDMSKGRAYPEEEHSYRDPFQRDRDRVIHSSAFRRLEKKTQVFVAFEGDYYRTRLTHTIEVAQISRTIARALSLNEELSEAIALAHDLGHSPFGHTGEEVLHELMSDHGGFEHNRQGLRIVDILESRYPDFRGLNLSYEVREGIIKHKTDYDAPEASEWDPNLTPTLEAQIVNIADEITYSCHDLDDGLKAGILTEQALLEVALCRSAIENMVHPALKSSEKMRRYQLIRRLIDRQVSELLETSSGRIKDTGVQSVEDVRSLPFCLVEFGREMLTMTRELKKFLLEKFYHDYRVAPMAFKARRIITALFGAYLEDPSLMPADTRMATRGDSLERTVCDYISGMTDPYAVMEYNRLFGPAERI